MSEPYRLWAGDDTTVSGLQCLFHPKCICGENMELAFYKPAKFEINDGSGEKNAHAVDVVMICPECKLKEMFGVAISEEHYNDLQKYVRSHPHKFIIPKSLSLAGTV